MEKQQNNFKFLISRISMTVWMVIISILIVVMTVIFLLVWLNRKNDLRMEQHNHTALTPTQVRSIESIGEWEFLAVNDEEMIDTVRRGFFGDDHLVRIYYGTLRLGINLHDAKPGWIKAEKDTVVVVLPPIQLLDNDFIDEARTQTFHSEGSWKPQDYELLYQKAYRTMKSRCLNESNRRSAEENASRQFSNMLRSMGFQLTRVRFESEEKKQ